MNDWSNHRRMLKTELMIKEVGVRNQHCVLSGSRIEDLDIVASLMVTAHQAMVRQSS